MRNLVRKTILVFVILFILIFVGFQIYTKIIPEFKTEIAYHYTVSNQIEGSGVVFRNEKVLSANKGGVVVYTVSDGSKVAKNSVVANTYSSESDASKQLQINELNEQIDLLSKVLSPAFSTSVTAGSLSRQIFSTINSIHSELTLDVLDHVKELRTDLMTYLLKNTVIANETEKINLKLSELKSKKTAIEGSISTKPQVVTTDTAGYFVSNTDGFEELCSLNKIETINTAEIIELSKKPVGTNSEKIGKVILGYEWVYAAVVDSTAAKSIVKNSKVTVSFPFTKINELPMTIIDLKKDSQNNMTIIYLKCDYMTEGTSNLRNQKIQITSQTFSGLRLNPSSVRIVNGQKGVYIKYDRQVQFKKINSIYETENLVIAEIINGDNSYLRQYDEVIVEGKDLYDGRICRS